MKKQLFFQSAVVSTILSYLLIFVGGLVRVSGSGMGCPDWPRCFGRWIPPTNVDQIPSYIDPTAFNIVLAWIEYGNRSLGVLVGFSIIVLNIIAIYYFRKEAKLLISAILSLILVLANGALGAIVVSSVLNPFLVSLHMILALMLVSVLSYACIESYKLIHVEKFKNLEGNKTLSNSLILSSFVENDQALYAFLAELTARSISSLFPKDITAQLSSVAGFITLISVSYTHLTLPTKA